MKWVKYYALLVLFLLFQTVLGNKIRIFGILPDLIFIMTICISVSEDRFQALIFALVAGLLKDFTVLRTFGLNGFLILYISFFVSLISKKYFYPTVIVNAIAVFAATFIYEGVYFFLNFVMWGYSEYFYPVVWIIVPESIYNTLLSFGMYYIVILCGGQKPLNPIKYIWRGSK